MARRTAPGDEEVGDGKRPDPVSLRELRQLLSTPLLMGEHVRGLEAKVDTIASEATDYVRANPTLDMGITGVMKIAHPAEAFGLDCEMHGCGPAHRHCMAALRNSNYSPCWHSRHGLLRTVSEGLAEDGAAGRNAGHDQSVVASFS